MFRSSSIIREPALNLAKFIFTSKHSVKLHLYLLCGCVAACHGMACVLCAVQNAIQGTCTEPGKNYICVKIFSEITSLFIMRLCGSMS